MDVGFRSDRSVESAGGVDSSGGVKLDKGVRPAGFSESARGVQSDEFFNSATVVGLDRVFELGGGVKSDGGGSPTVAVPGGERLPLGEAGGARGNNARRGGRQHPFKRGKGGVRVRDGYNMPEGGSATSGGWWRPEIHERGC